MFIQDRIIGAKTNKAGSNRGQYAQVAVDEHQTPPKASRQDPEASKGGGLKRCCFRFLAVVVLLLGVGGAGFALAYFGFINKDSDDSSSISGKTGATASAGVNTAQTSAPVAPPTSTGEGVPVGPSGGDRPPTVALHPTMPSARTPTESSGIPPHMLAPSSATAPTMDNVYPPTIIPRDPITLPPSLRTSVPVRPPTTTNTNMMPTRAPMIQMDPEGFTQAPAFAPTSGNNMVPPNNNDGPNSDGMVAPGTSSSGSNTGYFPGGSSTGGSTGSLGSSMSGSGTGSMPGSGAGYVPGSSSTGSEADLMPGSTGSGSMAGMTAGSAEGYIPGSTSESGASYMPGSTTGSGEVSSAAGSMSGSTAGVEPSTGSTTAGSTARPSAEALKRLFKQYSPSSDLESPTSPACKAFQWITTADQVNFGGSSAVAQQMVQRFALVALYFSLNGPDWNTVDGGSGITGSTPSYATEWNLQSSEYQTNHVCSWANVICSSASASSSSSSIPLVIGLALNHAFAHDGDSSSSSSYRVSQIPIEIGLLASLTSLQITRNDVTGNIPIELGDLTRLTMLDLSNNALSGPIPASALASLTQLTSLRLFNNQLTGSVPSSSLQGIRSLSELVLYGNPQLSGQMTAITCSSNTGGTIAPPKVLIDCDPTDSPMSSAGPCSCCEGVMAPSPGTLCLDPASCPTWKCSP